MLIHYLRGRTLKRCLAGHHLPERHPERIEVGTNVYLDACELFRTGKLRCTGKSSGS